MRGFGWLLLIGGAIFLFLALSMDTSVSTVMGPVNNLGLMNQKQTYTIAAGVVIIAGLLMALLGSSAKAPDEGASAASSRSLDPFDELDRQTNASREEQINARKRYAISLGVTRFEGWYWVDDECFTKLEDAIALAESRQTPPESKS
jgi:hypothetical protein